MLAGNVSEMRIRRCLQFAPTYPALLDFVQGISDQLRPAQASCAAAVLLPMMFDVILALATEFRVEGLGFRAQVLKKEYWRQLS